MTTESLYNVNAESWKSLIPSIKDYIRDHRADFILIKHGLNKYGSSFDGSIFLDPNKQFVYLQVPNKSTEINKDFLNYLQKTSCFKNIEIFSLDDFDYKSVRRHYPIMMVKCGNLFHDVFRPVLVKTAGQKTRHDDSPWLPNPLAATLAGAVLGGLVTYGLTKPFSIKMPKRLALIGATLGALPGLLWAYQNYHFDPITPGWRGFLSGWPFSSNRLNEDVIYEKLKIKDPLLLTNEIDKQLLDRDILPQFDYFLKNGSFQLNLNNFNPINKQKIISAIQQDQHTPLAIKEAASGIIESASQINLGSDWIYPEDFSKIATYAGSRLLSGALVGQVFSALGNLSHKSINQLQKKGTWAQIIKKIVPFTFE